MVELDSSAIERVSYDAGTAVLSVTFKSGGTYDYFVVPRWKYDGLLCAESAGAYFQDHIRDQHSYKRR